MSAARRGLLATAVVLVTALGLVAAPRTTQAAAPVRAASASSDATWTLMIYDVADTENIADEMIRNLAAFTRLPDMPNVNVVALVDLPEKNDPGYPTSTLPGVAPFTDTQLLLLKDQKWNLVRDEGELSMGRPDTLAGFIGEAADRYPAQHYGLVLSDHGGAWYGGYFDNGPPAKSHLSVSDMRAGILSGLQSAGIDRLDLIDHDSCLMSSYEVTSALAPLATVMVGSEEITEGDDTLTPEAIQTLGEGASAEQWGKTNIETYADVVDGYGDGSGQFSALSVIDGDAMSRLDAAVQSFSDVAVQDMAQIAPQVARARAQALEFAVGLVGESESFNAVDLGDFMKHLTDVPDEVAVARDAVVTALQGVVLDEVTRQATQQATGLNVFFPGTNDNARGQLANYLSNHVAPAGWEAFVQSYADAAQNGQGGGGQGDAGQATFLNPTATVDSQDPTGIRISGQLADGESGNVSDSATEVFIERGGKQVLASLLPAYVDAGQVGTVQGVWDYAMPTISSGGQEALVSGVFQAQSGGLRGAFYARYTSPSGDQTDVVIQALLDSSGQIQSAQVTDASEDGSTAGVDLENGGTLSPYFVTQGADGLELTASSQSIPVADDLSVDYPQLPGGTSFTMSVAVADLAGKVDTASVTATVPANRTR